MKKKISVNMILNFIINLAILLNFGSMVFAAEVELDDGVTKTLQEITQILLIIGGGVCVGKIIHIGILYVTSSAVDKSNAKMAFIPWIIGTFVCFGAAWIGKFVINVLRVDKNNVLDY